MKQTLTILSKVILLNFIILLTAVFAAHAQEVITLQKAVELTLERNLTIKQSQITEALGAEDVRQAKANQTPTLSVNPQASYNFGRSPNLTTYSYTSQTFLYVNAQASLGVTLFQGGQLRNQVLENKMILDADKTSTTKVKNDLILNVVVDYLQILTNQDLVTAAQQQIDIAKLTLDKTQKSFTAGNQTTADLAQSKAGVSTAELNMTTAQNQLASSVLTLKQYMEMSPDSDIVVQRPDVSKLTDVKTVFDANDVIKTAMEVNPDVHLAELNQKSYGQAIKVAKGAYYPTLSFFGGAGSNYSNLANPFAIGGSGVFNQFDHNFNQSVGLSLNIPIFNHATASVAVKKAKLNYEYAELTTQLAHNTLSKTIIQAVLDVESAEKSLISATQTYEANKEAFNTIQQRYNVGLVNSVDYNTSLTNYDKAQTDMIEAQYTVIFRSKVIDYYLGNPITL
jgi:outer membrane protein